MNNVSKVLTEFEILQKSFPNSYLLNIKPEPFNLIKKLDDLSKR